MTTNPKRQSLDSRTADRIRIRVAIALFAFFCGLFQTQTFAAEQVRDRNIPVIVNERPFRFLVIDAKKGLTLLESDGPVVVERVKDHVRY